MSHHYNSAATQSLNALIPPVPCLPCEWFTMYLLSFFSSLDERRRSRSINIDISWMDEQSPKMQDLEINIEPGATCKTGLYFKCFFCIFSSDGERTVDFQYQVNLSNSATKPLVLKYWRMVMVTSSSRPGQFQTWLVPDPVTCIDRSVFTPLQFLLLELDLLHCIKQGPPDLWWRFFFILSVYKVDVPHFSMYLHGKNCMLIVVFHK